MIQWVLTGLRALAARGVALLTPSASVFALLEQALWITWAQALVFGSLWVLVGARLAKWLRPELPASGRLTYRGEAQMYSVAADTPLAEAVHTYQSPVVLELLLKRSGTEADVLLVQAKLTVDGRTFKLVGGVDVHGGNGALHSTWPGTVNSRTSHGALTKMLSNHCTVLLTGFDSGAPEALTVWFSCHLYAEGVALQTSCARVALRDRPTWAWTVVRDAANGLVARVGGWYALTAQGTRDRIRRQVRAV
jgi:hypothetical protein